jgi:hypothetical protein
MIHGVLSARAIANGVLVSWHHFALQGKGKWEETTNNQAREPLVKIPE